MYICQYQPKDIIYHAASSITSAAGNSDIHSVRIHSIDAITIEKTTGLYLYLALILPEVVLDRVMFRFFCLSSVTFSLKITVDKYTNLSENYTSDYLHDSNFINPMTTSTLSSIPGSIMGTLDHTYDQLSHKNPLDRCIFRIQALTIPITIAAILLRAP